MIIEEKVKDLIVVGQDTSKKAKISQDKLAKLQYLLTKGLYKDPITAVIAEWTNNGIDSVVQAGKNPIDNPVMVTIGKDDKGIYTFRVEDKGTGLDDKDFEDICMNYLESTKEEDNDTIGHFGIGMKSFLSLERSATFTCRKDGVERKYLVYEGPEFVNYDLIMEKPTDEENGVIAELVIASYFEKMQFVDKAKTKLAYYDTAVLIVDNTPQVAKIYRNDLFQWSTLNTSSYMHISLKDVYYPIDWEALNIKPISLPVAIRLNLSDALRPTPSRESYITNEKTRQLIERKIAEIADWFVSKYNEKVATYKTFMEAYDFIGLTNYTVNVADKAFGINCILPFSSIKVESPKIDGITLRDPLLYKNMTHHMLYEYSMVGYLNYRGIMKSKAQRLGVQKENHIISNKRKTVLVGDDFVGNVKEYLKQQYDADTLFVKRNDFQWKLGEAKKVGQLRTAADSLRHILNLDIQKKENWRGLIKEFLFVVSTIVSTFIDETKVANSKGFQDWIEEKREAQKEKKRQAGGADYQGLGKQKGDVTLAYSYERYGKIHFKKEAFPIRDLHKNKFLTVIVTDEDNMEVAKEIILVIRGATKFAYVSKGELKKIPKHFQFINFKEFITRDCKPFMRFASALKFSELLRDYKNIQQYQNPVFQKVLGNMTKDVKVLQKYTDESLLNNYYTSDALKAAVLDIADEHKLYDMQIWDVYERLKKEIRKYDFITLLATPHTYASDEVRARYNTLINQILLFRKKFYNDLPEGAEIVFKEVKTEQDELV